MSPSLFEAHFYAEELESVPSVESWPVQVAPNDLSACSSRANCCHLLFLGCLFDMFLDI